MNPPSAVPSAPTATDEAGRFNEDYYDRFWAECPDFCHYNPGARHRRRIVTELLQRAAGARQGLRLLDVGCGDAELLIWLTRAVPSLVSFAGADLSSETVRRNAARLPKMRFHVLDISRGGLDEKFDFVVCSEVVEHVADRRAAFRNLGGMIASGGYLLVTAPTGFLYETERRCGHVSHPTLAELESHAAAVGLRRVEHVNWGWPLYKATKWATNLDADWVIRKFGTGRYSRTSKTICHFLYWANFLNVASSPAGCQLFVLFQR